MTVKRKHRYSVAVGNVGESDFNTIVLPGVEITVPLELDVDGDPLQDDEVRLRSRDGTFERVVLMSDAEAEVDAENRLVRYRFPDVPFGRFDLSTRIGADWIDIATDLVVRMSGVFGSVGRIGDAPPTPPSAPPEKAQPTPDPPPERTYLEQEPDDWDE